MASGVGGLPADCTETVAPAAAMAVLEELEETARLFNRLGPEHAVPLSEDAIEELRQHFGAHW